MSSEVYFDKWTNTNGISMNTVVQVQQTIKTDTWSGGGSGTTWYNTYFSCSITPTSATSKILVLGRFFLGTQYWEIQGKFQRNGVDIGLGTPRGSRMACGFAVNKYDMSYDYYDWLPANYTYLDSPATTSPLTYLLLLNPYGGNTIYINRTHNDTDSADYYGCPSSTITLLEISG